MELLRRQKPQKGALKGPYQDTAERGSKDSNKFRQRLSIDQKTNPAKRQRKFYSNGIAESGENYKSVTKLHHMLFAYTLRRIIC